MNTGRLRHPLEVQEYVYQSQDPNTGEVIYDWVTISREWGSIDSITGKEFIAASAEQAQTNYRITIRYRDGLTTTSRFKDGATMYGIEAILPNNDRSMMTCLCKVI